MGVDPYLSFVQWLALLSAYFGIRFITTMPIYQVRKHEHRE